MNILQIFSTILLLNFFYLTSNVAAFMFQNKNKNNNKNKTNTNNRSNFFGIRLQNIHNGNDLITELDKLRELYMEPREWTFTQFNFTKAFEHNLKLGKIQQQLPKETPFPCDLNQTRSEMPPKTVHELRPGDIDIIAVLGDSMSAGSDLMTEGVMHGLYENRGLSFSGGGFSDWRQFLTLPNILKVFNPNLYGYAIADGLAYRRTSRFNIAEPTAMSPDLIFQAKVLIKRLRKDPNVDMNKHWKLLTIFIGNVDFCSYLCFYDDASMWLRYHEHDLYQTLTLLRENIPRLFINLIPAANSVYTFNKMKPPPVCYAAHRILCGCVVNPDKSETERQNYAAKIKGWQEVDAYIAGLNEFNTDNFTIVYQPFFADPRPPLLPNDEVDQRFFAADCFHFSQLGQACLANALWNNMLQPIGSKQTDINFHPYEKFECPSAERPYLATKKNSFKNEA